MGLLLLAELCWLTIRFDVGSVGTGTWAADAFRFARFAPGFGLAFLAALAIIGGQSLLRSAADLGRERHPRCWVWLGCHLASFATLVWLSYVVFESQLVPLDSLWIVSWGIVAAGCLCFWIAAVAPIRAWGGLILRHLAVVLTSAGVGLAAVLGGTLTQGLWGPLADATFSLVERLLHLVYAEVETDPAKRLIGTRDFGVTISDQCSGYEGIGLLVAFLAAFFWIFRDRLRFPQAWLLWPLGLAGIWLLNSVRIAALIVVGVEYSPAVAIGGFHSQAGWILFNGMSLGLMYVALRSPFFATAAPSEQCAVGDQPSLGPVATFLGPLFCLVAMNMLVAAASAGFEGLYPAKVVVTAAALWACRRAWNRARWSWSWRAVADGMFVFALWLALAPAGEMKSNTPPSDLLTLSPLWRGTWILFRVAGSVITVPLAEELAFRGFLLRRLAAPEFETVSYRDVPWWAVILSSALFGLMHGLWLAGCAAGLWFAISARRRNNLGDAVLAHATANALIAAAVLLGGQWRLW